MKRANQVISQLIRESLPQVIGGLVVAAVVSLAAGLFSASVIVGVVVIGASLLILLLIGGLVLAFRREDMPKEQDALQIANPASRPTASVFSMEMLDAYEQHLTQMAHEITAIARPYHREDPLTISALLETWGTSHPESKFTEAQMRELLARLRQQSRLPGLIYQGDDIYVQEEHYTWKTTEATEAKKRIAQKAVSFVRSDNIVVLDSGSTTQPIAHYIGQEIKLGHLSGLTIVTNFFKIADELLTATAEMGLEDDNRVLRVYLVGGRVRANTFAIVGDGKIGDSHTIEDFNIILNALEGADLAFVGTNGVCWGAGFTTATLSETETKKLMLQRARRRFIVADPSKFGMRQDHVFAGFDDQIEIITVVNGQKRILDEYTGLLKATSTRIILA